MEQQITDVPFSRPLHSWLYPLKVAYVPGPAHPLLERVTRGLLERFRQRGHQVLEEPAPDTQILITTARFEEPLSWRQALLFTARRRFRLQRTPTLFTLVHILPDAFHRAMERLRRALARPAPEPADFDFAGLAPQACRVLYEQGRRAGPILALERVVQAQAKSIRSVLVIGEEEVEGAYIFDLAGAHPRLSGEDFTAFCDELALRMATYACTHEVTDHQVIGEPIPREIWEELKTPTAMAQAARELGRRNFFTDMVRIADLVEVPYIEDAVARQYSEGCFATWEPALNVLITTITGSARPINKDEITEDDLAVIVGLRADGRGALVREVAGKENSPPSSEAVELMLMDMDLPRIRLDPQWGDWGEVPAARSKLHGHRGVAAFDPSVVEFAPLDDAYYYFPVSCATKAQAAAIRRAFARSEALRRPEDARQVVFTILPGHGAVIVEKWAAGKAPFQLIWEYIDAGRLVIESRIPQGPFRFVPGADGRMYVSAEQF
ncbi:MAG: hypothetical protein ACUVT1_00280 [Anaerolineae bacterium]